MRALRTLLLVALVGALGSCYYFDPGPGPAYTYGLPRSPGDSPSLGPNYGYGYGRSFSQGYSNYGDGCCYHGTDYGDLHHRHWGTRF